MMKEVFKLKLKLIW